MTKEPKTLQQAILYFSNPDNCREYLIARRWPNGVVCPTCGSESVTAQPKYNRWQCASHHERRQFTLKTGTIFEDSPIGLDKWLAVMWLVVNCKNGISSYEIHRAIGVTQKSAWFMSHRVRLALGMEASEKLSGHVEADETYIGGKARNMHRTKLAKRVAEFATPRTGRNQLKRLKPAPKVSGKTPWKRLDNAVRHIFTVSKEDVLKEEAKQKRARIKKPTRRKATA